MLNWLKKIDDWLFSPPHKFQTILAYVVICLSDDVEPEEQETKEPHPQPDQETEKQSEQT